MANAFAFVFPGQGSQTVGMLAALANDYAIIQETFAQASQVLGYDLWEVAQQNPNDQLNQTQFTQPALLTAEYAIWQCWQQAGGPMPTILAGHSLGEYSALVCAGSIEFKKAVQLVAHRGEYMQAAVAQGEGAMAAIIGLDDESVNKLCDASKQAGEVLSPANFNSLGQIVIAGHAAAVDRAVANAKEHGAKLAKRIPVSVPSHCALMQPAADQLAAEISQIEIKSPTIPVVQNYDVAIHDDADKIREALIAQLVSPVRWVEAIQSFVSRGVSQAVECGPGKVLAGLNKRIDKSLTTLNIDQPENLLQTIQSIRGAEVCL